MLLIPLLIFVGCNERDTGCAPGFDPDCPSVVPMEP